MYHPSSATVSDWNLAITSYTHVNAKLLHPTHYYQTSYIFFTVKN